MAVYLAGRRSYGWRTVEQALTSLGAIAGLVAMTLMVLMVLLSARIPLVDRAIGHDGALGRRGPTAPATRGDHHSEPINQAAVPVLESEITQANSAQVCTVSGATYTTTAYLQSLQSALDQAR
ncbi:FMN-binding protein [Aestuariimicrobium ganziense]|uniref:FMN-binding protein n=1 Tax=Aestuariimicrobium ganziense TaxID=2773677 RepID=UPI00194503BC|nr:FMN-binding protein [Aestuariimicrobium ganziense]